MIPELDDLSGKDLIDSTDLALAGLIGRLDGGCDKAVLLAAALVSRAASMGHVCLDLEEVCREGLICAADGSRLPVGLTPVQWLRSLQRSAAVGRPGDFTPLILSDTRLYLHRYQCYEAGLAESILRRRGRADAVDAGRLDEVLDRLYPDRQDEQRRAVRSAVSRSFTVISGGPGTGKTYTIARIILVLQELAGAGRLRISLAAPTGKAAARLQESVAAAIRQLSPAEAAALDGLAEACTLHRLLGAAPGRTEFLYRAGRPLPADVVIVDEASMIDLAMMAKLVSALSEETRLILCGDKDQLASVEAGAVLGDICHGADSPSSQTGEREHIVVLARSRRFEAVSRIGALARAVNRGDGPGALELLASSGTSASGEPEIAFREWSSPQDLAAGLSADIARHFAPLFSRLEPADALTQLREMKILTVLRNGLCGAAGLNALVEQLLRRHGLPPGRPDPSGWYVGRPVMIVRNDYYHELFNGDVGILVAGTRPGEAPAVAFAGEKGGLRLLPPQQLPPHETVYAMTVHKSQGSEFKRVILILPDRDVPVLSRELIYTAVTRARRSVCIWGRPDIFMTAVQRRTVRTSGLRQALWPAGAE